MKFWDSSSLVPLLLWEHASSSVRTVYEADDAIVAWWATSVECESAIARYERAGVYTAAEVAAARERLGELSSQWREVEPAVSVRTTAQRLLRVHPLRAADALQLAAALAAAEGDPAAIELVCLDDRLAGAARREGFRLVPV